MKPLPEIFIGGGEYRGFEFKQIFPSDKAFLYQVNVAGQLYYHIFKKRINTCFGSLSYTSPEAFGRWVGCYRNLDQATKKYEELNISKDK